MDSCYPDCEIRCCKIVKEVDCSACRPGQRDPNTDSEILDDRHSIGTETTITKYSKEFKSHASSDKF